MNTQAQHIQGSLAIGEMLSKKVCIHGPHSKYEDGTDIPFSEQLAIISHYFHNAGTPYAKTYEKKALELIEDICQAENVIRRFIR